MADQDRNQQRKKNQNKGFESMDPDRRKDILEGDDSAYGSGFDQEKQGNDNLGQDSQSRGEQGNRDQNRQNRYKEQQNR